MKEERKRHYRQKLLMYFIVAISLAGMLAGGYYYVISIRDSLMEQAISNVWVVTAQQQQAFDNFITRDRERLHSFAADFSKYDSDDVEKILEKLTLFSEVDAVYTVVNLETGVYYNNKTDETLQMKEGELKTYSEFSESGVREPYIGLYTDTKMFGYYECFTFADGTPGLFQKGYESDRVSKEFTLSFYNDQGFAYIVNRQGEILLRPFVNTGDDLGDDIFKLIDSEQNPTDQLADFKAALDNRETGAAVFHDARGDHVYTYVPVENVEEWYLVSIVSKKAIMNEADGIINSSRILLSMALIALFVISVFTFFMWRTRRDFMEMDNEIEYQEQLFNIFSTYLSKNTDDAYLMVKKEKRSIEYASPNFERVLGISEDDALSDLKILNYTDNDLDMLKPGDTLEPVEIERINPKSGEKKWFLETIYCTAIQGEEKLVVYISDRTEERQTQNRLKSALDAAEIASKAKSTFLSSMSHDIRTPMNAIMGLVALLKQEADNPEYVLEYAQRIDGASQHLLGLINDVLDMNKIESGNATLNNAELSLAEIIDEMNTIIRSQVRAKKQQFEIYTTSFTYEHLIGDKMRINQILINILSNAVKYTPAGGRVEMSVCELPPILENYSRIQFTVKDNGQGMSEEYQKVMFDPFTREQNTTTNKIQGTGLGMAITKNLVELMGGTLKVESQLGVGTTFTVELELRIQNKEDDPKFWENHGVSRMIIADDEEETCKNVVRAMAGTGVHVDYVTKGSDVIDTIRNARERGEPYELILLDWMMPDMDGMETARLIRKNYSRRIPILLFTAYDWADIEQEALEVGINHFMQKPFFMSKFKEAIKRLMHGRNEKDASQEEVSIVNGKHILIVEDIDVNRLILCKILNTRGAACDVAVNGKEAVDKFGSSEPGAYDLILMDVQMPVMDGYEATRTIRAGEHPCAKSVPIIAMTANAFADDVQAALESGMNAHVSKPIVLEQVEKTIREVLEGQEHEGAVKPGRMSATRTA